MSMQMRLSYVLELNNWMQKEKSIKASGKRLKPIRGKVEEQEKWKRKE
jgi:hypothetical protein